MWQVIDTDGIQALANRLQLATRNQLANESSRADQGPRLIRAMERQLERSRNRLGASASTLNAVSPLRTLERGYAIVTDDNGHVVQSFDAVATGDTIHARLHQGNVTATVTETRDSEET